MNLPQTIADLKQAHASHEENARVHKMSKGTFVNETIAAGHTATAIASLYEVIFVTASAWTDEGLLNRNAAYKGAQEWKAIAKRNHAAAMHAGMDR